ncbi:MAG TPA: hypothetical protein VIY68_03735 [Steroidobacteraceae bacterium]
MAARLGDVLYWTCTGIALLFVGFAIIVQFSRPISVPFPYVWYAFQPQYREFSIYEAILMTAAVLAYLFGRALRYILGGK